MSADATVTELPAAKRSFVTRKRLLIAGGATLAVVAVVAVAVATKNAQVVEEAADVAVKAA